jgi:hypothetical protein
MRDAYSCRHYDYRVHSLLLPEPQSQHAALVIKLLPDRLLLGVVSIRDLCFTFVGNDDTAVPLLPAVANRISACWRDALETMKVNI